ncbi:MAG: hypothetical protein AABX25_00745 [Nanoarchaeota archaeon]
MLFQKYFYTEEGRNNIDRARLILKSEFGLVGPKNDHFGRTEERVLVWEDSEGVGRYRVHFYTHFEYDKQQFFDLIRFSYWRNRQRAKREIFEQDPMKPALERIHQSIEGKIFEAPESDGECSIDTMMDQIFQ